MRRKRRRRKKKKPEGKNIKSASAAQGGRNKASFSCIVMGMCDISLQDMS